MNPSGTLYVRPVSGKLLHDTEFFGKMDPYVKVIIGTTFQKTPIAKKQHLTPNWDCEFIFELTGVEDLILFEVYDKDLITKDDLIGAGSISISSFNNNIFNQWIPLSFKGRDAGALLVEMRIAPTSGKGTLLTGSAQSNLLTGSTLSQTNVSSGNLMGSNLNLGTNVVGGTSLGTTLEPIIHAETVYTTLPAEYIKETPLVYEKKIITEKPIITERTEIYTEQPILIERHELREQHMKQQGTPQVIVDNPILVKDKVLTERPNLTGPAVVRSETEYRHEAPEFRKETTELFEKQIITEQPVVHEKDIIHRDITVIHQRPEIHQQEYRYAEKPIIECEQTKFLSRVSNEMPDVPEDVHIHHEQVHQLHQPIFTKERPEVFEKKIVQDKAIIHEQPIVYAEQQVLVERPEVRETRVFHQETPIVKKETGIKLNEQSRP